MSRLPELLIRGLLSVVLLSVSAALYLKLCLAERGRNAAARDDTTPAITRGASGDPLDHAYAGEGP